MTLCEKCIHGDICVIQCGYDEGDERALTYCSEFKSKDDVTEVRHGEWKICSDGYYPYCSRCEYEPELSTRYSNNLTPYCPNCGAKMDGERTENE